MLLNLSLAAARHPKRFFWGTGMIVGVLILLAGLPSLFPATFSPLNNVTIDTDPENMLSEDAPVRVRHDRLKKVYDLHDYVVVGVVNDTHRNGVFNPDDLSNIHRLTTLASGLEYPIHKKKDDNEQARSSDRVIAKDIIAPSVVDNIESKRPGQVSFSWMMRRPPTTQAEAKTIQENLSNIPMYDGTMVGGDGKSLALYYPISDKSISHQVEQDLKQQIKEFKDTGAQYHITGLPVAEDRFGSEMFFQMAVSAPLAMAFVFLLLWLFFRHVRIIIVSLVAAVVSVITTMSLLIISGQTIHIMSSMIPIFIIPIAVLDDIHILSDFYDRYRPDKDRFATIREVMDDLWRPMWYTTLTTSAGFASLMLTPIPPVQVFGAFVAIGVGFAWFFTVTLLPAYFMTLPDDELADFGAAQQSNEANTVRDQSWLGRFLRVAGPYAGHHAKLVIGVGILAIMWAGVGMTKIVVNDNPIKWFEPAHEIRVADRVINDHFAGSYMAYLQLTPSGSAKNADKSMAEPLKNPSLLTYIDSMKTDLADQMPVVGKISGLPDIVKTVHRELFGRQDAFVIPDNRQAVAQTLLTFQNSHRPDDLWTFVTPDYDKTTLWFQMKSGDNRDMERVERAVDRYIEKNPPPTALSTDWFGLTYINKVWQEDMVSGMSSAFLSSFAVVLILTSILFGSIRWGVLAMVPLSVTVAIIYGAVGWVGKDYDMPTAVLSSLSLGLAVDYAIHFLARCREIYQETGNWEDTLSAIYEEPARAISRNVIVVGAGFLPLLLAHLVPYQTVGILISSILILAGATSLIVLPALITQFKSYILSPNGKSS
jgi:predicted RND superfamily exporter protein